MTTATRQIAAELALKPVQVEAVEQLLGDGATVPFIARYRKEATGSLDEVAIQAIRDRLTELAGLEKRRAAIRSSLAGRGLLTPELERAVAGAATLSGLEDLYLPHRPKRRTRAMIAREKGLEPLAAALYAGDGAVAAKSFVDPGQGVDDAEAALAGARDIIAEWISEDARVRARLRDVYADGAVVRSAVVEKNREQGGKFRDYFAWEEPVSRLAGHRLLAMLRGEQEKVLSVSIRPPEEQALALVRSLCRKGGGAGARQVELALEDSYRRLLAPSLENELRSALKKAADSEAIDVFAGNLRQLLLAPPFGQRRVMALDPGFRTGAKLVCLDAQGGLLEHATVYPVLSARQREEAAAVVEGLCRRHAIEAVAVGNGTAGRETEAFVRGLDLPGDPVVTLVDESGASIYSASEIAREEFPDLDLTVRGAISIGRRLQDPLAELVKLDPKAIGVGQYQHDVDQAALKQALADVVESCVNGVGVELNSASVRLLTFVAGLGPALAAGIVAHRAEHGPFTSRRQLLRVPRLGAKAFEQCAGFLRIRDAADPLDRSAVHPERYALVQRMAADCGCTVAELMNDPGQRARIEPERYLGPDLGRPTLEDILAELARPGRDPRQGFSAFRFADGVNSMDDLEPGMVLPGIVTNVTRFGAFVDIGVHQDGLVHISQMADRFVRDPAEVVRVRQEVRVRVLEVDARRGRISLSLRGV